MNPFLGKAMVLFIVLCSTSCRQGSENAKFPRTPDFAAQIDTLIRPIANSNNFSGIVFVKKNDSTILSKPYGYSDRESQTKTTVKSKFLIGSISAMFTAVAIMQLVEEGKLSVDDPLNKFIPKIANSEKITIHHLLTERSGLPRVVSQADGSYAKLTKTAHTLDELVDLIKRLEPIAEPGMKYRHSGSSYILLAKVIELLSGESFGEYLEHQIFAPLGMTNTGHYGYDKVYDDIQDLAIGYEQEGVTELKRAQRIHWSTKIGHASIYSTAHDLNKFAEAIMHKKLLTNDSWTKMTASYYGSTLGYGISSNREDDRLRHYRSGSSPGFSCYFAVYPEEGLTVIMLSNIKIHIPYFNVPKIAAIVFGEDYEQLNLVSPTEVNYDLAREMLGTFQFDENFYNPNGTVTITYDHGMLLSDGAPLIPVVEQEGQIIKFINRQFWSRLEFVPDSLGNYSKLKFDEFIGERSQFPR